jgi:hypothetical protein
MSSNQQAVFAFILAYGLSRLGEFYFKFKPYRDLSFWRALVVDFGTWILIFSLCFWIIGKFVSKRSSKT